MTKPDDSANRLLQRAYELRGSGESRALYRAWASSYDRTMLKGLGYVSPLRTARMLLVALPLRRARVLDVGCGTGLAAVELARRPWIRMDGLDTSPSMLAVARRRGIYDRLLVADLDRRLPIGSNCYDALICTGTFTHAHVDATCLPELIRILRPGGRFAGTIHRDIFVPMGFAAALDRLTAAGRLRVERHEPGGYYRSSEVPDGFYFIWQKC